MKKSIALHIIVMLVAVLVGGMLAKFLHGKQNETMTSKEQMSRLPIGGFHKFASDIEWMLFINYMGGLKSINDDNKDEVIRRLNKIISLNPNFEKAIHMGALSLSNASPEKAVDMLAKACESKDPSLKSNWGIPFLAGFILVHYYKDPKYFEAAEFFRKALERSNGKPEEYVVNCYLRARGNAKGIKDSKLAILDTLAYEWKKNNSDVMETTIVPELTAKLIKAAKVAKEAYPDRKEVQDIVNQVSQLVMGDKHLCPNCLSSYGPGDKFCSSCGTKVKVYGVCPKCQHVLKGNYCSHCGYKAK